MLLTVLLDPWETLSWGTSGISGPREPVSLHPEAALPSAGAGRGGRRQQGHRGSDGGGGGVSHLPSCSLLVSPGTSPLRILLSWPYSGSGPEMPLNCPEAPRLRPSPVASWFWKELHTNRQTERHLGCICSFVSNSQDPENIQTFLVGSEVSLQPFGRSHRLLCVTRLAPSPFWGDVSTKGFCRRSLYLVVSLLGPRGLSANCGFVLLSAGSSGHTRRTAWEGLRLGAQGTDPGLRAAHQPGSTTLWGPRGFFSAS